jgi:hypothetical protein
VESNHLAEQPTGSSASDSNLDMIHAAQGVSSAPSGPETPCPTCDGGGAISVASYVYALGTIEARFPRLGVEKEFAQATGRAETSGLTDREVLRKVLSARETRYLVRQLCWVLTIEGLDVYILRPDDASDFELLVDALRPAPRRTDVDAVIGLRGPIAPPDMCNGLLLPIVTFHQLYSFDVDALIKSIPRPKETQKDKFAAAAEELFIRMIQLADNAGATPEHRALNYLVLRYPAIYAMTAEQFSNDFSLTAVEARPSPLSQARSIVDVVFSYTNRNTDFVEKFIVRVDVTEEFPFLVSKLSPYYDH